MLTIFGISVSIAAIVFLTSIMGGLEAQFMSIVGSGGASLIVVSKVSTDLMMSKVRQSAVQK